MVASATTQKLTIMLLRLTISIVCLIPLHARAGERVENIVQIAQSIDVAPVWAGHPVRFALLTHEPWQLVAYYDAQRQMTVGLRRLDSTDWRFVRLALTADELTQWKRRVPPTELGWDSHNFLALAVDADDCIHLSGNMHASPLVYFRTEKPMDIDSFRWIQAMTGEREKKATYPRFITGIHGELIFTYRDGGSGNGDQIVNLYNLKSKTWGRLFDQPLFSGGGRVNAYFTGPIRDRSGMYHLAWVWRDTPDCSTNHDVCYARSADLVHWTTSGGKLLAPPITLESAEVVDPIPSGSGLSNGNVQIGFDLQQRPVLSYHKFDAAGNTQAYSARRESQGWRIYQTTDWAYRWDLRGGGTLESEIRLGPVVRDRTAKLTQSYRHVKYGEGVWLLDEATLKPIGRGDPAAQPNYIPPELKKVASNTPDMTVQFAFDLGRPDRQGTRYLLRWETRDANRDRPYSGKVPDPTMLRVIELRSERKNDLLQPYPDED
jgi:hypothetical protein